MQNKPKKGKWYIEKDGSPFDLKGVGCALQIGKSGIDYLQIAKELGANTVRTWGIKDNTKSYLDEAEKLGLKVDVGIWLKHCNPDKGSKVFSYINNEKELKRIESKILSDIKKFKDHPAVLMWNVGNEVLHFTKDEDEHIAFCKFLERVFKKIKEIDRSHPVMYTFAGKKHFHYLKKYVPSIDIIGVNTYSDIDGIYQELKRLKIAKPFIITESEPYGPWDSKKDKFGMRIDISDYEKAFRYQYHLEEKERLKGSCLGVFAFRLGDPKRKLFTWWDLTVGKLKRESFYVIQEKYTGKKTKNKPPLFTKLELDKYTVNAGGKLNITINARDRENDPLTYAIKIWRLRKHNPNRHIPEIMDVDKKFNVPKFVFKAPNISGLYKLIVYVYDDHGNIGVRNVTFKVEPHGQTPVAPNVSVR